jgi:hypothetical protein
MTGASRQIGGRKRYLLGAVVGGIAGCAATFIYVNIDPFERMAAAADGFSRWTLWQLPFTVPEGAAGAVAGMLVVLLARVLRRRTPTG